MMAKHSRFLPEEATSVIKGQVLVDIGAGETGNGYMFASRFGAKGYVGVEPNWANELSTSISKQEVQLIPAIVVKEGMLDFLKRLPDKSVSVMAVAIDHCIITSEMAVEVSSQIERVLDPMGGFINAMSNVLKPNLRCSYDDGKTVSVYLRNR
jgi:hypothetical protein